MAKTIKDLAKEMNCSYEAVRKQVKRYSKQLKEHIYTEHKTQYLDDYACDFLRDKRQDSPVVVSRIEYDEAVELLKEKYTAALEEISRLKDEKQRLTEEKYQLEVKVAKTALLEAQNGDLSREKGEALKEAGNAKKAAQEALQALEAEKQRPISFMEWLQRKRRTPRTQSTPQGSE